MPKNTTKIISRAGIISCLYLALSLLTFPISSGAVQLRVSEFLTLLPLIYIEAVPALFVGCMISNLITGCAIFDLILGSLVTLISAILTYIIGKIIKNKTAKILLGGAFPVLLNAFLLPLIWLLCYGANEYVYIFQVGLIFLGQTFAVYGLGTPAILALERMKKRGIRFLE